VQDIFVHSAKNTELYNYIKLFIVCLFFDREKNKEIRNQEFMHFLMLLWLFVWSICRGCNSSTISMEHCRIKLGGHPNIHIVFLFIFCVMSSRQQSWHDHKTTYLNKQLICSSQFYN